MIKACLALLISGSSLGAEPTKPLTTVKWTIPEKALSETGEWITVVEMNIADGWHSYWKNPGEAGLPLSIKTTLPKGWEAGELQFPFPKKFMTGELHGYGYENLVRFPLSIKPPAGFSGVLPPIIGEFSWLICNDKSCKPGRAKAQLITSGSQEDLKAALAQLPKSILGSQLRAEVEGSKIKLQLIVPQAEKLVMSSMTIYPATPDVVAGGAEINFVEDRLVPGKWITSVPTSEFINQPFTGIEIVALNNDGQSYVFQSTNSEKLESEK